MKIVHKRPSRMQGQWFFRSWAEHTIIFGRVLENLKKTLGGCPSPCPPPLQVSRGHFNIRQNLMVQGHR